MSARQPSILAASAVFAALVASSAFAAPRMTLPDCVGSALQANPSVLEARESLARARGGISEARASFYPSLSLGGSYNFAEKVQRISFPDPLGGSMKEMELDFTRDYGFQLSLSQPVYAGGKIWGAYRVSRGYYEIAEADLERRQSEVALSVYRTFYGLLLSRESVAVMEQAIATAEEHLRVARARYSAGEASSFDVMRSEVEVANLRPALIRAKNGVALAELALKNAMSMSAGDEVEFVGSLEPVDFEATADEAVARSAEARPEIRMARVQQRTAEDALRIAKAGRLPNLALTASYDFRSDAIALDGDRWETAYAGYLVLDLPLFDGFRTKAQISQSLSEIRRAEVALRGIKQAVELEVRAAVLALESAGETLESQQKNVEMAEEGLRIADERYAQGVGTNLEVMDAQLAVTQARTNRIQALHDLNVGVADLKKAMGVLLARHEAAR